MDEVRPQRVPLDVAAYRVEVVIVLNRKRFEATLVHVSRADRMAVSVPALGMGERHPTGEFGQIATPFGPENKVPMLCEVTNYVELGSQFLMFSVFCRQLLHIIFVL